MKNSTIAGALICINLLVLLLLKANYIPETEMTTQAWVTAALVDFYIGIFLVVNTIEKSK